MREERAIEVIFRPCVADFCRLKFIEFIQRMLEAIYDVLRLLIRFTLSNSTNDVPTASFHSKQCLDSNLTHPENVISAGPEIGCLLLRSHD